MEDLRMTINWLILVRAGGNSFQQDTIESKGKLEHLYAIIKKLKPTIYT